MNQLAKSEVNKWYREFCKLNAKAIHGNPGIDALAVRRLAIGKSISIGNPVDPEKLRTLRQELRVTQEYIAGLVYTTQRTVARWEAGASPIPQALWELLLIKVIDLQTSGEL